MKSFIVHISRLGLLFFFGMPVFLNADEYWSAASGVWDSDSTWEQSGYPGEGDIANIKPGHTVNVSGTVFIDSLRAANDASGYGTLNISGESADFTVSGESRFWNSAYLNINVTDGANASFDNFSWGYGGHSNILVDNAAFNGYFSQMMGSVIGSGSKFTVKGSSGTATIAGHQNWNIGANENLNAAGHKMTVEVLDGAKLSFNNAGETRFLTLKAQAAGSSAVLLVNGGYIESNNALSIENYAGAENIVRVYGANSKLAAQSVLVGTNADKAEGGVSRLEFGGFDAAGNFVAASAKAIENTWEFKVQRSGELRINLGAENALLSLESSADAIVHANFFKTVMGDFVVDLTNADGLVAGQTYFFALISSSEEISDGWDWNGDIIDWGAQMSVNVGDNFKYVDYHVVKNGRGTRGESLFIEVTAIPEPSVFAVFAAFAAMLFAFSRRLR